VGLFTQQRRAGPVVVLPESGRATIVPEDLRDLAMQAPGSFAAVDKKTRDEKGAAYPQAGYWG